MTATSVSVHLDVKEKYYFINGCILSPLVIVVSSLLSIESSSAMRGVGTGRSITGVLIEVSPRAVSSHYQSSPYVYHYKDFEKWEQV